MPQATSTSLTCFVIGDPHFKLKYTSEGIEFSKKVLIEADHRNPDFIVILGDTLDTHEVVNIQPHNIACSMIDGLRKIAPVYLIIGNHDLINHKQYLTDQHIFNPLKQWDNVTVVDKPIVENIKGEVFTFCPYVENGKFGYALEQTYSQEHFWDESLCIFAHQEFKGCKMGAKISEDGDEWEVTYPMVVSGHIHSYQVLGNIYYPGSAIQHAFGESHNKRVWLIDFGKYVSECKDNTKLEDYVEKIDLDMPKKVILRFDSVKKAISYNLDKLPSNSHFKVHIKDTSANFESFRRSDAYKNFQGVGVKFSYDTVLTKLEETPPSQKETFMDLLEKECKKDPEKSKIFDKHITPLISD